MNQKRGQFFILAAIILSSIIITLGAVQNSVILESHEEASAFYDLSEEIKQESAQVIDYGVVKDDERLAEFSEVAGNYVLEKDVEILFIYGDEDSVNVENYGKKEVDVNGDPIPGANQRIESKIKLFIGDTKVGETVDGTYSIFRKNYKNSNIQPTGDDKKVRVKINEEDYDFNLRENRQFFMIIKKTIGEEDYVDVK